MLFVCFFEILHASDEGFDVFDGAGIVEGGAEAADGAVTLDADHAALFGEGHEGVLFVLVARGHHPAVVHDGAVSLVGDSAHEHAVAVDFLIQEVGFLHVDLVHFGDTTDGVLEPGEGFVHHEDGEHGRSVEHGDVLGFLGSVGAVAGSCKRGRRCSRGCPCAR